MSRTRAACHPSVRGANTRVCRVDTFVDASSGIIAGSKSTEISLGAADTSVRATKNEQNLIGNRPPEP